MLKKSFLFVVMSCLVVAQATAGQPSKAPSRLPTAVELTALLDKATRIEARSGIGEKPTWSKDLTKADIADLEAGIGEATGISATIPRCAPTVIVTLYQQKKKLAELAILAGCNPAGPIRFDIDKTKGCFMPQDMAKVNAALEPPVDR